MKDTALNPVFFVTGFLLALSELWKQWCITFVVNGGAYDWWYFPFQLCSLPMYLLPLFSRIKNQRVRDGLLAFFMDYTLLGSLMVWVDPSGLFYPLTALTVHSFLWHIILALIGLLSGFFISSGNSKRTFLDGTLIYGTGCLTAVLCNFFFRNKGDINMFYINPGAPVTQPIFRQIAAAVGQVPSAVLYVAATIAGAGGLHLLWMKGRMGRRGKLAR